MRLSLTTKTEHIRHCILRKTGNNQNNNDLNWIKDTVMNTLTDNIPYIENRMMTTYVRNGKLFVEIIDGRTVDIMKQQKEREEQKGLAKLYTIMHG